MADARAPLPKAENHRPIRHLTNGRRHWLIHIGHPGGILERGVDDRESGDIPIIDDTFGFRTENLLLEGAAVIRMETDISKNRRETDTYNKSGRR